MVVDWTKLVKTDLWKFESNWEGDIIPVKLENIGLFSAPRPEMLPVGAACIELAKQNLELLLSDFPSVKS